MTKPHDSSISLQVVSALTYALIAQSPKHNCEHIAWVWVIVSG